jgi:hypothetical protein
MTTTQSKTFSSASGGHVDFVGIDGKVDEGAFLEAEQGRAGFAVVLILMDGVARSGR